MLGAVLAEETEKIEKSSTKTKESRQLSPGGFIFVPEPMFIFDDPLMDAGFFPEPMPIRPVSTDLNSTKNQEEADPTKIQVRQLVPPYLPRPLPYRPYPGYNRPFPYRPYRYYYPRPYPFF